MSRARLQPHVLAAAAVLFVVLVAHALLETARDALFLARLGPHLLAAAYLVMAVAALLAVAAARRWGRIRQPRRLLIGFLLLATAGTSVLAATITLAPALVFVLYVWTGFVATLVVPTFWTAIDRSLRITEAKRVFGTIGAGGVLGAMAGSAIAGVLGRLVAPHYLVTAGALAFAIATVTAFVLVPRAELDEIPVRRSRVDALSRSSRRYIGILLALGVVSTIVLTLGDLTFKMVVAARLPASQLASVFGEIYTGLNAVGLVVQLVVTPRLLARWGVGGALTLLPLILVASALGFVATGTLIAVIALKLGDGSLRHSLHRVSSEILYLPVPAAVRDGWKLVADALGQRGGQALAALLVFASVSVGTTARGLAALTGACGVAWLVVLAIVRRAYAAQFRDTLQAGEIQRDVALPALDADSIVRLTESLASPDEIEALAALELLARYTGVPALVFYHPRTAVVRRALALLDGELRPEVMRVLGHLLEHTDPKIRAAALAASLRTGGNRALLLTALDDPEPEPRAVALVGLACAGDDVAERIAAMVSGRAATQLALAEAIAFFPEPRFRDTLLDLLAREDVAVTRQVLHVWTHAAALAERARLLGFLADPRLRGDARVALLALGRSGLDMLIEALDDPHTPAAVRRHLPRTISRFRSATAAAALVNRLPHEPDSATEQKLLRALGRMRTNDPALPIDPAPIRAYLHRVVRAAARYATFADYLALHPLETRSGGLIQGMVAEQRRIAVEHAFRALGILHPLAGLRSAHDAFTTDDEARRGAAREIVMTLVPSDVRVPLLAVLDDLPPAVRRARTGDLAPAPFHDEPSFLAALLADPSEWIHFVVAAHVNERPVLRVEGPYPLAVLHG
ncbi:MAG: hypothetical protein JO257_07435 [Deltaproteobacteria bacterium]|nr:hypothetical protein [Deltaproteobacteria bacterium]